MALVIGPGFQEKIQELQATPISNENDWGVDFTCCQVIVSEDGQDVYKMLVYNKLTNGISVLPFE